MAGLSVEVHVDARGKLGFRGDLDIKVIRARPNWRLRILDWLRGYR